MTNANGVSIAAAAPTRPRRDALRGARVLVVDDADVIRDVSRALLEDAGITVEEAADGAAALQWLRDNDAACDLILMDVQMPVLDGIEATQRLRDQWGERAPLVVAMTAQALPDEKRRCYEAGMVDHLSKPLAPAQLLATLKRWLVTGAPSESVASPVTGDTTAHALPAVPGFDAAAGLAYVGGNAARLAAMLARFGVRHAGAATQLRELIAAARYHEAHRAAHTLKGTAATLGGTAIAEAAAQLELALSRRVRLPPSAGGVPDLEPLAALERALQMALPALRALGSLGAPEGVAANGAAAGADLPHEAAAEYQALRQMLAGNNYAARKAFAALRARVGDNGAAWQAASAAVDQLDFQRALQHLDARYPEHARALS